MTGRVTRDDVLAVLPKLEAAGYRMPDAGASAVADVWVTAMEGVGPIELRRAVDTIIREGATRYWPKPADVRQVALGSRVGQPVDVAPSTLRGRYLRWEQHSDDGTPCPVCGAVFQKVRRERRGARWLEMQGTRFPRGSTDAPMWGVLHDPRKHMAAQIPHVGLPMRPDDETMYQDYTGPAKPSKRAAAATRGVREPEPVRVDVEEAA